MMSSSGSRWFALFVAALCGATLTACTEREQPGATADTRAAGGDVAMSGDSAADTAATTMNVPTTDAGAVDLLMTISRGEVEAGELAQEKARDPQVKAFAREMVRAHGRGIRQLEQLARQAGISTSGAGGTADTAARSTDTAARGGDTTARTGTDTGMRAGASQPGAAGTGAATALQASHQATMGRLRGLEGADFDSAYMAAMVSGHQQALDILQRVENNVQNQQLDQHVTGVVSTVRQHLDRAREVQQGLATPTGDTGQSRGADTGRATTDTSRR